MSIETHGAASGYSLHYPAGAIGTEDGDSRRAAVRSRRTQDATALPDDLTTAAQALGATLNIGFASG